VTLEPDSDQRATHELVSGNVAEADDGARVIGDVVAPRTILREPEDPTGVDRTVDDVPRSADPRVADHGGRIGDLWTLNAPLRAEIDRVEGLGVDGAANLTGTTAHVGFTETPGEHRSADVVGIVDPVDRWARRARSSIRAA
jgi:hypothetical protein